MINVVQLIIFMLFCINATLGVSYVVKFFTESKPKTKLNRYIYAVLCSSVVWSIGMSLMSLQNNDYHAYFFRTLGIMGTFAFMISIQIALCHIAEIPAKAQKYINGIAFTGIPIFFAYSIPGQTIFVHNYIGTTFYFKPGLINSIYSLYFTIVSLNIFIVTLRTVNKNNPKKMIAAGKRIIIVELCVFVGAIFDMFMPSLGYAALPGSAITHFWGVIIFWRAIHEMYKSELTIANMSEYVYHSINTPLLIFNPEYQLEIINSAASQFFGIQENEVDTSEITIGKLFDIPEGELSFDTKYTKIISTCLITNSKCEVRINKILDSYQDNIGYICLINDLTEHEMVIAGLKQAKLAADAANMSKSLFLANMSHEIRTPMNAILGFSEIALMENIDDTSRGFFNEIKQAGGVLLSVINDILNISKIELGKYEIENSNYNLAKLIQDVELITRTNANKKGLKFTVNMDSSLPEELYGDSNKIREILLNILSNAVKYTNVGGIDFAGSVITDKDSNTIIKFVIRDTGIGIREEDIPSIFEKFSRVDAQLNSSTEGTGLGLSITKGLVDLLGGTIEVSSVHGVGSAFTVEIPQKIVSVKPIQFSDNEDNVEKPNAIDSLNLSDCRFLVVDDNKINLKVSSLFLSKYGASVDKCLSGAESIELCKANEYDIIFMDHMMPEMDGVEAMKLIRLIPGYELGSKQKLVALTANAVDDAREYLLSEGFDDYISKPMKKEALEEVLVTILGTPSSLT